MKILMVGATGKYARLILPELTKRGARVCALVRNDEKAHQAMQNGAHETVRGDLLNPASLESAVQNIDSVFHIGPAFAPEETDMGLSMVKASQKGQVKKFVFLSAIHPALSLTNHANKRPVEEAIVQSGLKFVILQPAMFMQNLEPSWNTILKTGKISLPYSNKAKACYVDFRDVAEVAAIGLTEDKLDNGTFELCAPGMIDRIALAQIISSASGKSIQAMDPPFEEWAKAAGLPAGPLKEGMKAMFQEYDKHGFVGGNSLILQTILGRQPRTIEQFIKELALGGAKVSSNS